jgi:hypothetical protein
LGAVSTVARVVHVLILSVWLGASLFFVAVLAPEAFSVLPSRELAGTLITTTLNKIDLFGLIFGPVLRVTLFVGWLGVGVPVKLRALFCVLMTLATGVSGRWLTPEMVRIRQAMGRKIEDVAATDPLKIEFGRLHTVSTSLMAAHMLLAFLLIIYAVSATAPKKKYGIEL